MDEKIMGEFKFNAEGNGEGVNYAEGNVQAEQVNSKALPTKVGFWTKFKNFLFQDIHVELTPYQQKVEDEINEFLHQEVTWQGFKDFLFQDISFGKNK